MVNARHLFYSMRPYQDPTLYVTLGDGSTQCPIAGIGNIEMVVPSGSMIRLHDAIFVPTLNVSLYSISQHMRFVGCSEHSSHNRCTIAFPCCTFDA